MSPIIGITFGLVFSFVLSVGLLVFWKLKTGARLWTFITGALCFSLFAMVLESALHLYILNLESFNVAVVRYPALYILYGSLAAGLFEETGRLFGFKVLLSKHNEPESAVAYGIGHGGIEVLLIVFSTYLIYLLAMMGVPFGSPFETMQIVALANSITLPVAMVSGFERISAMILHIGLSLIMYRATKVKGKLYLYPLAVVLHAIADVPAAMFQMGYISSITVIEVVAFITGVLVLSYGIGGMKQIDYAICRERKGDYRKTENLVRESFWNVYRPGCLEHYVLKCLRKDPAFVKKLDFVMKKDGKIIGQNCFVKTAIKTDDGKNLPIMTMGPISIAPEFKRKGYGKILLDYSLQQAEKLGCGALCFEGNIDFYGKSGFTYASEYGIRYHGLPEGEDSSFFLCKELIPGYLDGVKGEYSTPEGYFVCDSDPAGFEKYEAKFPKKEKLKLPGQLV